MIIVQIKGGLGNQMFQYAFGRAYTLKHGDELKLDISGYPKQTLRAYDLQDFNIKENIATDEEIQRLRNPHGLLSKVWRVFKQKVLRKHYLDYHPELFKLKQNAFFEGYFQSEQYFSAHRDILLREFALLNGFSTEALAIHQKIQEVPLSVSLHIRRGDYVTSESVNQAHGLCPLSYYEEAIQTITNGYPEAHFFVFSDDIEWVKQNLPINYPTTYVSGNIKATEEMMLMSTCLHHIIANSTFSWWGAWLNQNPDKIVIAPKKWTNKIPEDHPNIIPSTWTRL